MENFSSSNDQRRRVLQMVENGQMSAVEAITMLENLAADGITSVGGVAVDVPAAPLPLEPEAPVWEAPDEPQPGDNGGPLWLRIRVTDVNSGRKKVSVNIPMRLADWGLRIGARFSPEIGEFRLKELADMLHNGGLDGKLIDVVDEEDGEHVEIYMD